LNKFSKLVTTVLFLLPLAVAQQSTIHGEGGGWVRESSGSLPKVRNLRVKVEIGSVRVQGGAQNAIDYSVRDRSFNSAENKARRDFDSYKVSAYVRGDTAWLVGEWEHGGDHHDFASDVTVQVPHDMDLVKIETDGGSVSASTLSGHLDATSGGGTIRAENIGGMIDAETGGGPIDVSDAGSDVNLHTGGGPIRIASAKGKISAESGGGSVDIASGMQGAVITTGGGSISVEHCNGLVKASTGGGSINLGEIGGPAEMETGGGSIRLASAKGPVRAESGGGSIDLNGIPSGYAETSAGSIVAKFVAGTAQQDSELETAAGDITVYLAPEIHISLRASIDLANGHTIRSDFPEIHVTTEGGEWGPKSARAEGSLNGGGPTLKIHTTTGSITIRRGW
jgi:DUF4097 and DUF4098 domain-containing protein YvlB